MPSSSPRRAAASRFASEQRNGHVHILVEDNGHGISREFLPHVFERFRQQDSSTTRESAGLGLGLSIAKHLVELHGGTISALSDGEGRGAKFIVELPASSSMTRPIPSPVMSRVSIDRSET